MDKKIEKVDWIPCPKCGHPHLVKVTPDTVLINAICYCKHCKSENKIDYSA